MMQASSETDSPIGPMEATAAPVCPGFRLVKVDPGYDATAVRVLSQGGYRRAGYEAAHLSVSRFHWMLGALKAAGGDCPLELVASERRVEGERLRKDAYELAVFRQAGRMVDVVTEGVLAAIKPGMLECDLAAEIDWRLKKGGFEKPSFDTIVASGPNSALPHARPGRRALQPGDLVVLDFGGVYDGYCVDLTRTVCVGQPSPQALGLYEAVAEAQVAALAAVRPGARVSEVDAAARGVLDRHNLGHVFGHATGHGLGLEIHEEPRVGPLRADIPGVPPVGRDEVLTEGVVITIEPGAYVPGLGGVRIEDDCAVVAGGAELLTQVSRKLVVV